jgi:RecB family exonuclease
MIEEFVSFELNRIAGIFNTVGKSLETIKAFVLPVATELAIENWSLNLMGIIDVIYRATNGKLIFVEYKYGKPKNYEISYNHSFINLELGFYSLLVQGKRVYAVVNVDGKDTLVPIQTILGDNVIPYYGAMIFFQDLESSGFLIPITKIMLTNTKKKIAEYKRAINTGKFCEVPKDSCYEWCAHYWEVCKYNPKWLEIKHALDDKPDEEIIDLDEELDDMINGKGDMDSDFDPMYE